MLKYPKVKFRILFVSDRPAEQVNRASRQRNYSHARLMSLDINGSGANSLKLSLEDVLDMTDGDDRLFIDGGPDDSLKISDGFVSQCTENVYGVDYTHYYDAGTDSHLYINNDISGLDTF